MILDNLSWGKTQYLLNKAMDTEMFRRKVIADNIANANVPHFKRTQVSFEAQLRRVLDSEKYIQKNEIPTKLTDEKHIPFFRALDYKKVHAKPHIDYLSTMRNDGNNVDMEHEMSLALKNQLRYQLLSNMTQSNFRTMNMIMRPL